MRLRPNPRDPDLLTVIVGGAFALFILAHGARAAWLELLRWLIHR